MVLLPFWFHHPEPTAQGKQRHPFQSFNTSRDIPSCSTAKEFRRLVLSIVRQDGQHAHMPDYAVKMEDDMVIFTNRRSDQTENAAPMLSYIRLNPEAYHEARAVAPGWDVYVLEQEWREWMTEPPRDPNAAFIGFCKKVFEKRDRP